VGRLSVKGLRMSVKARVAVTALVLGIAALAPMTSAVADSVVASDGFGRTVANGLGTADAGGAWSLTGTASNFSVGSGVASLRVTRGKTLSALLPTTSTRDTDVTTTVRVSALPVGGSVYAGLFGRRAGTHSYSVNAVVSSSGAVHLSLGRDGTTIGSSGTVGPPIAAGTILHLRMQAVGSGTTTVRAREWPDGTAEPTSWQVSKTDATAANQVAGTAGISAYLSSGTTNDPIVFGFDDFAVTALGTTTPPPNKAPTASFALTSTDLTAALDATASSDTDGSIASYSWNFGDGATGTGTKVSHSYAAAGTYTITLTVTDNKGATGSTTKSLTVAASSRPTQAQWLSDVATALGGGSAYLDSQTGTSRPAIVLDIDNTSLQSYYQAGAATPPVLSFEQEAIADGYAVLFATGRGADTGSTMRQLQNAGYRVDSLCFRDPNVSTQTSKTNCRAAWVAAGYTIVANVGNHTTDLDGGNSGKQYLLPNYGFLD
jgi:PKD repeat protein